ncbi:MAG: coproporphyrinogen-III oxidase family protein [Spirochaetes bacterium]|nr:coproporphyrinogen-III oxidase family protein [Spirochaetota bacterium]
MKSRASAGPLSLYVHVPFCRAKCAYCDFYSLPVGTCLDSALADGYVAAVLAHTGILADRSGASGFDTIYVGGGTPTALPMGAFVRLIEGLANLSGPAPVGEWSCEANPESLDAGKLRVLRDAGVNRVSLGLQDMDDDVLRAAGRASTTKADALRALDLIAAEWSGRFSADFICGLPGQTPASLTGGLVRAIDAGAGHVSLYDLTLEAATPLAGAVRAGRTRLPGEDSDRAARCEAERIMGAAGLRRYEVSNYAFPGQESRHNQRYWESGSWIGVGPSASGSVSLPDGSVARSNCARDLDEYIADPVGSSSEEIVAPRDAAFEFLMMGMRTFRGVDAPEFHRRFGVGIETLFGRSIDRHPDLVIAGERGPAPTSEGLDLLNVFLRDCLAELAESAWRPGS